jgi:hypothetical protein
MYPPQFGMTAVRFVLVGRDAGQTKKALRLKPKGLRAPLLVERVSGLGTSFGLGAVAGTSASARLSLRTELARTLLKTLTLAKIDQLAQ